MILQISLLTDELLKTKKNTGRFIIHFHRLIVLLLKSL